MKTNETSGSRAWLALLQVFVLMAAGIVAGGCIYYRNYEQHYRAEVEGQLSAIAELKVGELAQWRKERLGDGSILFKNAPLSALVRRFFEKPEDADAQRQLQIWLGKTQAHYQYDRVVLLDAQGVTRMSVPAAPLPISALISQRASEILRSGQIAFQDFHRNEHDQRVYLAVSVPVLDEAEAVRPLGVLVLHIDPESYLYPFIKRWPTPSRTAETLLIRRDGSDALFLNELKFQTNTALNLRRSLEKTNVLAVKAALGQEGILEGIDYRGVPVVGDVRAVPDSPWFLIARMDSAEVYAALRERLWQVIVLVAGLLLCAGTCVSMVWRQQRVRFYRKQADVAEALREREEHYRSLFEGMLNGYAYCRMLFSEGRPQDFTYLAVNRAFEELTGLKNVVGKKVSEVIPGIREADPQLFEIYGRVALTGSPERFEIYVNALAMWFSISVYSPRKEHFVAVFDVITERERSEQALKLFRTLVDRTNDAIEVLDPETGRFLDVNDKGCQDLGYSRAEFLALSVFDIDPMINRSKFSKVVEELRNSGAVMWEGIHRRKDGSTFPVEVNLRYAEIDRAYLVAVVRDITERKQAGEALRENEHLLSESQRIAHIGGWSWDLTGPIQWTDETYRIYGVSPETFTPTVESLVNLVHPEDRPAIQAWIEACAAGEKPGELEFRTILPDGTVRFLSGCGELKYDAENRPLRMTGTVQDITERKRAEEALRRSEENYRIVVHAAHDGFWLLDAQGRLLDVNEAYCRFTGYSREQLLVMRIPDIEVVESPEQVNRHIEQIMATGTDRFETRHRCADGRTVQLEVSARYVPGDPGRLFAFFRDITERKHWEEKLADERTLLRTLVDHLPVSLYVKDTAGRNTLVNPVDQLILGVPSEAEALGKTDFDFFPPEQATVFLADDQRVLQTGQPVLNREERIVLQDGSDAWLLTSKVQLRDASGRTIGLAGCGLDITDRKRAEESHARLATAVEQATEAVMITDVNATILYVNPAFEKITGYTREEALGQNPRILKSGKHDAEFYRRMWAELTGGAVWSGHLINQRKNGTLYEEDCTISPVRDAAGQIVNYVAVKRDVTEQKKLAAQMLRTQRLESIGTLAGGVAHDLNNALAPIMMANELLRLQFPDTASKWLDLIQTGAQRAADMAKQLLTFAKGAGGERLLLQPRYLLKEMEKLIQGTFPKNIELRTSYAKDLRSILGDATQLHQVLLNLCVNARDAMPQGGTLTLKAENMEIDDTYASTSLEAKRGSYVVWRVVDTGTGIPPEMLDRIFEPFFTTKGPDLGTGIGLSTVLGIVKGHGGFTQVHSVPGQGSTFSVYLPAGGSGVDGASLPAQSETAFRGHGETILVVDDESAVREMMRSVLTALDFKILTAADGTEALVQVAERRAELRAVITDMHMPHMDGLTFVRTLKYMAPEVAIIVASGRLEEREENELKALGVNGRLDKPFTQQKLVAALKTIFPN